MDNDIDGFDLKEIPQPETNVVPKATSEALSYNIKRTISGLISQINNVEAHFNQNLLITHSNSRSTSNNEMFDKLINLKAYLIFMEDYLELKSPPVAQTRWDLNIAYITRKGNLL
jgi:hypothetical protein